MNVPGLARNGLIVGEPHQRIGLIARIIILIAVTLVPASLEVLRVEPPWRVDWFDMLSRSFPREAVHDSPVRIVVLQDAPGGEVLQGTWPRDRLARLVDIIGYSGAHSIGLDVPLDGVGIYELVEERADVGVVLAKSRVLAEAMARHRVVAPVLLQGPADTADTDARRMPALPGVRVMQSRLSAHPVLQAAAATDGLLIDDLHSEERLRRVPMVGLLELSNHDIERYDSIAIELVRLGLKMPRPDIGPAWLTDHVVQFENGLKVPIDRHGNLRLYLRPSDPKIALDADDVIFERVDPSQFRDRFVVITTGYGDFDGRIDTTLFRHATTGEIMAQTIEQILTQQFVYRPSWMPWAEILVFVVMGSFFVFLFSRYSPARIIPFCVLLVLAVPGLCAAVFAMSGLMIDGMGFSAGLLIVGAAAFATNLVDRDQEYHVANLSLVEERAAKSRLEGELDVARRIQMSLLPPENALLSGRLEIACHIEPAQEVGGDFYDYVERPDGQVFFSIGDVSGKGVPASLFMALSKSLWKSAALIHSQLSALQEQANRDITRDNRDHMFVTGVGCLFEPETQVLRYCGAGHDMPILARHGRPAETLNVSSGPPLGLDNALAFPSGQVQLQPGDLVCLFTDGLTEAELDPNIGDGFFGVEGVEIALQHAATSNADASTALQMVLDHLEQQTAGSAQSDDRTLVVVRVAEGPTPVDTPVAS